MTGSRSCLECTVVMSSLWVDVHILRKQPHKPHNSLVTVGLRRRECATILSALRMDVRVFLQEQPGDRLMTTSGRHLKCTGIVTPPPAN